MLLLLCLYDYKQFTSRIFNQHRLLGKKRNDTWIYEDKKMQKQGCQNDLK